MCVIYVCNSAQPDEKELARGARCNTDGAGVAWLHEEKVRFIKGLKSDPDEVMKVLEKEKVEYPFIIHFRWTSIGASTPEFTHPFPLSNDVPFDLEGETDRVFFQNGTWKEWDDILRDTILYNSHLKCPEGSWSDTRALAFLAHHKGTDILNFLGGDSRMVVLNSRASGEDSDFHFWGKWIGNWDKDGFIQSIDTETQEHRTMGGRSWSGRRDTCSYNPDVWEDEAYGDIITYSPSNSSQKKDEERAAEANRKLSEFRAPDGSEMETWTMAELRALLMMARKELEDARKQFNCVS